jgi:hypothetical protein
MKACDIEIGSGLVFIGGCPRSGTTWLQLLLGHLPGVFCGREAHLFDIYAEALLRGYESEKALKSGDGIRPLYNPQQFEDCLLKPLIQSVLERYASRAKAGDTIVEKTPANLRYHDLIARLFPKAKMMEVVRDPRSVVASWQAASIETWGTWTRKSTADVAALWIRYVNDGISARKSFGGRFQSVQYEELHRSPRETLRVLGQFLELDVDERAIERAIEQTSLSRIKSSLAESGQIGNQQEWRPNFFRRGEIAGWRDELTIEQIEAVESSCGEIMRGLGYQPDPGRGPGL